MQPNFSPRRLVDSSLGLVISDETANILCNDNGRRHWRRLKITQYPPILMAAWAEGNAPQAPRSSKLGSRGEPILNNSRRIFGESGICGAEANHEAGCEFALECGATLTARMIA
jgi:hypothetical protein